MENKAGQFLERYRETEEWVLNNLKVADMKDLEQMPQYKSIRSNLAFCRMLRNLLSHYDWSKADNDMIIVTDQAVRQVNKIYYAINPLTLMRLAVRAGEIFAPSPADSVLSAVKIMQRNDYSYIPIVENYYFVINDTRIDATKREVEKFVGLERAGDLKKFLKENKIKWKNTESLKQLLKFLVQ